MMTNWRAASPPCALCWASIGLCAPIVRGTTMRESATERWLTYGEIGQLFGITPSAARMLARRRGWARRTPNAYGDRARVLVPDDALVQPRSAVSGERPGHVSGSDQASQNGRDQPNLLLIISETVRQVVEPLSAHLEHERQRADDAVAAERIAAREATALRAELDRRREWSLWRRLRWAFRP